LRPAAFLRLALLITATALAFRLGEVPLLDSDEGRNAQVAREMALTNNYVVPHLDGMPYLDKPILYFAAEAALMEFMGPTELAARLPAYLFTLMTTAVVLWFARRTWGEEEGYVAAIVFLAMPLTVAFARIVIFDSALTFFVVVATIAFYEAVERRERRWATLAWAAIAFGVLTKGPVAIVLPLFVAVPHAIWRKAFGKIWSAGGLIAFVAIVTPWVWAMQQAIPDFLQYVVVTETAARLATKELQRTGPPWYFIPYLVGGALPWSILALSALKKPTTGNRHPTTVFLLLWIVVPFLFFSISQSKRPQYILPLMVPVALLVASSWQTLRLRRTAIAFAVFGALLLMLPLAPQFESGMKPVLLGPARVTAWGMGAAMLIGSLIAATQKERRELALAALAIPIALMPAIATPLMHALAVRRSGHAVAAEVRPHLRPETRIIGVNAFSGSLAFYLGRPITLASDDGSELTSNYILRRYDRFARQTDSPLKTPVWLEGEVNTCCAPRIFIARTGDRQARSMLEQRRMRLISQGERYVAYQSPGS